jgi:protein involved in polysaccharide export with SLBB domain
VTLVKARPQQVFVLGPVAKPGTYEIQPGWRISEALAAAGGLTVRPALTETVLSRPNGKVSPVNLGSILNNSNSAENLPLQPGDRLLVTERTLRVNVTGQVKSAGQFSVPLGSSAVDALAFAGGALPDAALSKATIRRTNGLVEPVNLFKAVTLGDKTADAELREGDVLSIPKAEGRVAVQGSVARPGFVDIEDGRTLTVAQAVAQAGNYTDKAALTKAAVQRAGGEIIPVNLYDVLVKRDATDNILLQPGDVLTIPEADATVTVLGAVNKPGIFPIPDGQSLSVAEAVAQAGNYSEKAALTRATVRHDDGSVAPIDLYQIIVRGQQQKDVRLQPGDVVVIPESKGITVMGSVARPGSYYMDEGAQPRLAQALANAGDLETNLRPQDVRINITRTLPNGEQRLLSVDPTALFNHSDPAQNAILQDGDLVTVAPIAVRTVLIGGEVEKPGAYELKEGESVPQLIARAGGAKDTAALQQVRVTQGDHTDTVDVLDAVRNGQTLDYPLQPGASVVVPENKARVLVLQAVNKPGAYPIPEDEVFTLGDALSAAGGPQPKASRAIIARKLPNGQVEQHEVSFDPQKSKGGLTTDIPLQSGDVVYVPDAKVKTPLSSLLLSAAAAFSYLF